jgi:hypothetical protein
MNDEVGQFSGFRHLQIARSNWQKNNGKIVSLFFRIKIVLDDLMTFSETKLR